MTTLRDVLAELTDTEHGQAAETLSVLGSHSALGAQAVLNLYAETRLCVEAWRDLIARRSVESGK